MCMSRGEPQPDGRGDINVTVTQESMGPFPSPSANQATQIHSFKSPKPLFEVEHFDLKYFHGITEWFGLEGTSNANPSQPQPWAGLPPTSSGCPGPHPTWP